MTSCDMQMECPGETRSDPVRQAEEVGPCETRLEQIGPGETRSDQVDRAYEVGPYDNRSDQINR